jgi:hypothetical protein
MLLSKKLKKSLRNWLLNTILIKIRMIQREQNRNFKSLQMLMKYYLIQKKEKLMISLEKRVLDKKKEEEIQI